MVMVFDNFILITITVVIHKVEMQVWFAYLVNDAWTC